jgi:membrane fusion protein, copper/silver efflux system
MKIEFNILKLFLLLLTGLLLSCKRNPDRLNSTQTFIDSDFTAAPTRMVMSDQTTVRVTQKSRKAMISVLGYVSPNPERTAKVAARFSGRIERLYFNYNYQYVKKGTKIMDVYSPDLNTYQDEYLYLLKSSEDKLLLNNTRKKLRLLGMSDDQINLLEKRRVRPATLSVVSPATGYLFFEEEDKPPPSINDTSPMAGADMSGTNDSEEPKAERDTKNERIRQGAYITEGQTLFSINDLREVWGIFSVSSEYGALINIGMPIAVRSELYPSEAISAKINFIEPSFAAGKKFIRIRVSLSNSPIFLKTNSLLTARIFLNRASKMQVPSSSIYNLGTRKIVWVYTGKKQGLHKIFEAKEVATGITANGFTQIISGLDRRAEIAKDAGFLMDSESLLPSNE